MKLAVLPILCILPFVRTDKKNHTQDDPRFASLGKHFAGTPTLLTSLAVKEKIICLLLRDFQKESVADSRPPKTEKSCPSESSDNVVDLVEKYSSFLTRIPSHFELKALILISLSSGM